MMTFHLVNSYICNHNKNLSINDHPWRSNVTKKSTTIIGAGIAGLSAGCYGQMNGYDTRIFEMHNKPGGCCTTWESEGYKIDGCLHWLTGSNPGQSFYPLWEELGAVQGQNFIHHDEYARIEGEGGKAFIVYSDINQLEQHMKELAPEDKEVIEEFVNGIRTMAHFPMPVEKARELYGPIDGFKMMLKMRPYLLFMRKWENITVQDFAQRLKNPFLRQVFPFAVNLQNSLDFPMLGLLQPLAWMDQRTAGYPVGGSLEFSRAIERRYLALGGKIHYESRVEEILVENDKAVGVQLDDGSEHHSDIVISAADGRTTIFDMLDGNYINGKIQGYYDELPPSRPVIYISLGVDRSFDEIPHQVTGIDFPLESPITIGEKERNRLNVQIYNFDPSLAPAGKTVMRIYFASDYEYWKELMWDPERYEAEKEHIADQVVSSLDRRFPGLADQVEMWDVATPMTFERYTGNWLGTFLGWKITTKTLMMGLSKTLPGLENFYMAGQWVQPGGGVPTAAMSGRNVTQIICKRDKKPFITTVP
jgi:phytoene dehydrogenase-like protein